MAREDLVRIICEAAEDNNEVQKKTNQFCDRGAGDQLTNEVALYFEL